jgi:hypothetical protein
MSWEKNRPKCGPIYFCQNYCITFTVEKVAQNFGSFCNFRKKTTQSKQPPMGEKFAQSGHPFVKPQKKAFSSFAFPKSLTDFEWPKIILL